MKFIVLGQGDIFIYNLYQGGSVIGNIDKYFSMEKGL